MRSAASARSARLGDARSSRRFPITMSLRYRAPRGNGASNEGCGKTVNLSSTGVLFESQDTLRVGQSLDLLIDWPARIDDRVALVLFIVGRIVRISGTSIAAEIVMHEFRIRPTSNAWLRQLSGNYGRRA